MITLQEWIDQQGGRKQCAEKFGFAYSTLRAWYRLARYPAIKYQAAITEYSAGNVDFTALTAAYVANQKAKGIDREKRQRRMRSCLPVASLARMKAVIAEFCLPVTICEKKGSRIVESWAVSGVTVKDVRNAVLTLQRNEVVISDVELIHQVIESSRSAA